MTFPLPLRDFRWMTEEEVAVFNPNTQISDADGPGYILEVDLEYPEELHLPHNSFPVAPENIEIPESMLSPYSLACKKIIYNNTGAPPRKLTATFRERKKYLVHGLNLKLYMRLGLKLKKIHRIIAFHQERFIKSYIDYCTRKRKEAKTESERTYWKLIVNALYGKLIEGTSKRMDCHFNRTRQQAMKRASSPYFKSSIIFSEELSVSFARKKAIQLNKQQWAIGFSILDLSKLVMQELYYDKIQPRFGVENTELLMTDTDSFLLKLTTKFSQDECMAMLEDVMDFSNYPSEHPLHDSSRAKELGYLKNEMPTKTITSFVGLKSKTYAIKVDSQSEIIKAKGVPYHCKKTIPLESLIKCLRYISCHEVSFKSLRSKDHVIHLIQSDRLAFSSFDDKRYLLCPQHSVPYGSILIPEKVGYCFFCDEIRMKFKNIVPKPISFC
jgi:hypothetical protein